MRIIALISLILVTSHTLALEGGTLPDGGKGFIGHLKGTVTNNEKGGASFKISGVLNVDKNSTATKPDSLIGQVVRIVAGHGAGGSNDVQAAFVRGLDVGDELTLNVRHSDGDVFLIMELTQEQRDSIGPDGDRRRPGDNRDAKDRKRPRGKN